MSGPVASLLQRQSALPITSPPSASLQRCGATPCACSQDEDVPLMRQRAFTSAEPSTLAPIVREALPTPGQPLESGVREFFEPRFGHDFGAVRVHTDEQAARAADAVDALAFTVGNAIWFGRGMYQPRTPDGRRLLAHELTHTIQQGQRPTSLQGLRVGAFDDPAEAVAERAAEAVLLGAPLPLLSASRAVIRRVPKVSPVANDPSQRMVDVDDLTRYRVTRIVKPEEKTVPGEETGPTLKPKIDKNNVWLQVNWCRRGGKGDIHGEVQVGADLPAEVQSVLTDIGNDIKNGTDPRQAINKAKIKPFASVHIAKSERFSVDVKGGPTIEPFGGGVTGGAGKATVKIGGVELEAQVSVTERAGGGRPDVRVTGGVTIPLGSSPEKVTCKTTYVVPKISYSCEKIVPAHSEPKNEPKPVTHTHYFYYEYAQDKFATRGRTAALDAEGKTGLKRDLDNGYRVEEVRGYASPEGPVAPARPVGSKKAFEGNKALSEERADAAARWIKSICPPESALSMRPSCFAQGYKQSGEGELYGSTPEGKELFGKPLAEHAAEAFREDPEEASRRTPEVLEELERRPTAEAQTDTVYPLLRRAKIVVSGTEMQATTTQVPESAPVAAPCPDDVIRAVADDFDKEPTGKEVKK